MKNDYAKLLNEDTDFRNARKLVLLNNLDLLNRRSKLIKKEIEIINDIDNENEE